MVIFIPGKEDTFHSLKDIKIVIDGTEVLNELLALAVCTVAHTLALHWKKELSVLPLNVSVQPHRPPYDERAENLQRTIAFARLILFERA